MVAASNIAIGSWETVERTAGDDGFREFLSEAEPRLRRALVAAYGTDRGREAACDALAYAWVHWERLRNADNLIGYLYRVGQTSMRTRRSAVVFDPPAYRDPVVEPALPQALARLPERQRVAVVLVHAAGWTIREAAEVMGVNASTVQRHVDRALASLRREIVEGV